MSRLVAALTRRSVRAVPALAGAALLVAAGLFGSAALTARDQAQGYGSAPRCGAGPATGACWSESGASIVRTSTEPRRLGPAARDVEIVEAGARRRIELLHHDQWRMLFPGEAVGVVGYGGHAIGISAAGVLYPSTAYPAAREMRDALEGWALGGVGIGLLLVSAALVGALGQGRRRWLWPSLAAGLLAGPAAIVIVAGVVRTGQIAPGSAPPARSCARPAGDARPAVAICRTSYADLVTAIAPAGGGAPVGPAAASCGRPDGSDPNELTAAGLVRALREDGVRSAMRSSAGPLDALVVGSGAAQYVAGSSGRPRPEAFAVGVFPDVGAAEHAIAADPTQDVIDSLSAAGVPGTAAYRRWIVGHEVIFELFPSLGATSSRLRRDVALARSSCPLMRVIGTPPARDRIARPAGPECAAAPGVPGGGRGFTPAGLARDLRANKVPVALWGPGAGRTFAPLVGRGAEGYVVSRSMGAVPPSGLVAIGVYRSAAAARSAWNRIGRHAGVGSYLRRFDLPGSSRFQSLNQSDNLVIFQIFPSDAHALDQAVLEDITQDGIACIPV